MATFRFPRSRRLLKWLVLAGVAACVTPAAAQFRVLPPSPPVPQAGSWRQPRVVVPAFGPSGYYGPPGGVVLVPAGYAPWTIYEPRICVQVVAPVLMPRLLPPAFDLSGVDLDVAAPPWAKEREEPPRVGVPAVVKPPAPEALERIEPPKREPLPPEPPKPAEPVPAKPNAQEGERLLGLGVAAFNTQAYGLAVQRLQQAIDADPAAARPHFLLGQAYLALGKFKEAVQSIGVGLAKDPAWPRGKFHPRLDLYQNQPADWQRQIALLEETQQRQPQHAGYLFLLAYVRWFDDDRETALRLFREVRPLVGDPALVDLFLKAAP